MQVFDTREDMIQWLPKGGQWMEVGVFRGEFAESLNSILAPEALYLVDFWEGLNGSGDKNGNNFTHYDSKELEAYVRDLFSQCPNVHIQRTYSNKALEALPDNSLDGIYIDADHSYEGCKRDLDLAYKKVKSNGWICGHDYLVNSEKANHLYRFGVTSAVNDLCREKNLRIEALAMDGYVSYAIHNKK